MFQQKWRRWIADLGCQFGFFEARIWNSGFLCTPLDFLEIKKARQNLDLSGFFQSKRLSSDKTLFELHIHYKSPLTRVWEHTGYKEYCKDFTVALKIIHVIYKKQTCDSAITGEENASKDWNCIIIIPCCWPLGLKFRDWLLHWLKLTNLFSKAHSVCSYYTIHICQVKPRLWMNHRGWK